MFSKYLSHWLIVYFIFWLLGYIFDIKFIVKYINPYYSSIVLLIGYILLQSYNIFIKKYRYEYSFLLITFITHLLPLLILYKLIKDKHKYSYSSYINLVIIVVFYIIYMKYIDRDIYNTYFIYKPPLNWKEYFSLCDSKESDFIPYCNLFL